MKLRKLAALAMTAVMSLAVLAGCGSDDEEKGSSGENKASSISEAYEKAAAMEKYTLSGSFTVTVSGEDVDIDEEIMDAIGSADGITLEGTWDGKIDTKNNAADISVGVSLGGKSEVKLLDCILADGDAYIGLGTFADGMETLVEQILSEANENGLAEVFGAELPDGNYLKVSEEDLKEIVSMMEEAYGDMLSEAGISAFTGSYEDMMSEFMESDEYKQLEETLSYFAELIVKGMKDGSDTCFTNDGDTYKMTISKNNINDIFSGIIEQIEDNSDEIADKINDIAGETVLTASQLEQAAALLGIYDVASLMEDYDFSFTLSASYVDDTFKTGMAFAFSDGTNRIALSIQNTSKKDDTLKISAPTDVIDEEDAQPIIDALMEGLRDELNATSGILEDDFDYDWDDDDYDYSDLFDDYYYDDDYDYSDLFDDYYYDDDYDYSDLFDDYYYDDDYDYDYDDADDDTDDVTTGDSSSTSDKLYGSIKEYVESDEFQAELESQMSSYESMGMSMDITAEGNKLVYTYKYTDEQLIDDNFTLEDAREYFDTAIETQKSTFTSLCEQLPLYIDVEDPVIVLRYYDLDGTLIWEREFTAED